MTPISSSEDARVLLLSMPWASAGAPSLGLGTLKSILERDGIATDVHHFNLDLAHQIGFEIYDLFSNLGGGKYRGEILFTPHYYDLDVEAFVREAVLPHYETVFPYLRKMVSFELKKSEAEFLDRCRELALGGIGRFLAEVVSSIEWTRYDIVGFTLMFDQTLASLCIAKWIKSNFPEKVVVFGGSSCDGDMGPEIVRSFWPVDIVAVGEADRTVTRLVRAIRSGAPLDDVPGIAFRRHGGVVRTAAPELLRDLDWLPVPDFDDYFERTEGVEGLSPRILFESSRGCWWGQKSLCTFCGLNANGLQFRRKTEDRVVDEILFQEQRYGVHRFFAADNILDVSYFRTVLPRLREINRDRPLRERMSIFYETKSNLKKQEVKLLREAGVDEIQPGIESFNDGVLERMRKGSSGIQQIQFVKWATEYGLDMLYGIIHSNPNDEVADYREMERQVDFICHLAPPAYLTPVILDRFSPYYREPESYGITAMRANTSYSMIFPDESIRYDKLAYRFDFDHPDQEDRELRAAIDSCMKRFKRWQEEYRPDTLVYDERDGEVLIVDRRGDPPRLTRLTGLQAEIFMHCDHYMTVQQIARKLDGVDPERIEAFLELLVERRWVYGDGKKRYIALPVHRRLARRAAAPEGEPAVAEPVERLSEAS